MSAHPDNPPVVALKNLGPASAKMLAAANIHKLTDLQTLGAIKAYLKTCAVLQKQNKPKPSLNLLYALQGALQNCHWQQISRRQKADLLIQMDAINDIKAIE